ncbi:MAG: hypothetical protein M1837_002046 [Sclerophora amabilis]|nr:MAG: hypothetical protein M1837_002046 [Sclerophora amabilis]
MSHQEPQSRPSARRKPLGDATARVNNSQASPRHSNSAQHFANKTPPHHESLKPDGILNATEQQAQPSGAENRRVSAVVNEYNHDSNRNSHISTTSTNASGKSRRKTHVGPWRLGRTLGRGATGRVRLAKHAVTGQYAAIKIVSKASATMVQSSSLKGKDFVGNAQDGTRQMPFGIEREVVIMKLIEHPNVVSLYDVWENRGELYLVLEYIAGGELFDYVVQAGRLEEMEAVRYFRQIIAALTYCHAFNICHRDLKPENILLDQDQNIKIADFGMAALQPNNSLLKTACGSPHYAPPEIVKGQRYNGNKADIWSCGVILFVMLCGYTPFDDENVRALLDKVRDGWFAMPEPLSEEAKDLIWRMLEVDPTRRISMSQIWRHPLLRKYEAIDPLASNISYPPIPSIETIDHPIRRRGDIDGEILRNLQTLWHGEKQEVIIQNLMNEQSNQEKVFYCLLLKYRADRLEDYQGTGLEHSASDYHHSKPPPKRITSSRQLHSHAHAQTRQRSQFSILSHDQERPRDSYYEDPQTAATVESYDPFRSSRNPMSSPKADHAHVTVFRKRSNSSRSRNGSVQRRAVTRLNNGHRISTRTSMASSSREQRTPPRQNHSSRRDASKSSLASSAHRNSVSLMKRPSSAHKRGVVFSRFHKSLNRKSGKPKQEESNGEQAKPGEDQISAGTEIRCLPGSDSPPPDARAAPRSRKAVGDRSGVHPPGHGSSIPSHVWKDEARQVSTELEKFCDEAFNRSSASSSGRTTATEKTVAYESPISSVSALANSPSPIAINSKPFYNPRQKNRTVSEGRPLPPLPLQSADSFTEIQLAETRERLRQRAAQGVPEASQGYLDDVIAHLDRLMQPSTSKSAHHDVGRRIASATPDCKSPNQSGYLPAITEEERQSDADEFQRLLNLGHQGFRAASEPVSRPIRTTTRQPTLDDRSTIRLVQEAPPTPLTPIAPLNVRKRSGRQVSGQGLGSGTTLDADRRGIWGSHDPNNPSSQVSQAPRLLDASPQVPEQSLGHAKRTTAETRRRGWFKRSLGGDDNQTAQIKEAGPGRSESSDSTQTKSKISKAQPPSKRRVSATPSEKDSESELEKRKSTGGGKRGFFRIFSRRASSEKPDLYLSTNDLDDSGSINEKSVPSALNHPRLNPIEADSETNLRSVQPQRNWLTRFLHIKPASKILCFDAGRLRARREIIAILKDWRKYGLKDVTIHKQRNIIFGRVDAQNFLHIRPVSFAAEIFTVLEHGKRANLSIARFTQEKGAASSFQKVVDTLETLLSERGLITQDQKRKRAMMKVLSG